MSRIQHVLREAHFCADALAKAGCDGDLEYEVYREPPQFLRLMLIAGAPWWARGFRAPPRGFLFFNFSCHQKKEVGWRNFALPLLVLVLSSPPSFL